MMRWAMVWLSTPEERKLFGRGMDHEPLLTLIRDFIHRKHDLEASTRKPASEGRAPPTSRNGKAKRPDTARRGAERG
jgi:hypothetical protein